MTKKINRYDNLSESDYWGVEERSLPGTGKDIVSMGLVEDNIRIDGMNVTFSFIIRESRMIRLSAP